MIEERQIIFHGQYFKDFYIGVSNKVKEKIGFVFRVIKSVAMFSEKFLKHVSVTDGLYEIRVEDSGNIYRIFCCFDKWNVVVLFNAFEKKTQKTPKPEIEFALKLKKEYFTLKEKQNVERNKTKQGTKKEQGDKKR